VDAVLALGRQRAGRGPTLRSHAASSRCGGFGINLLRAATCFWLPADHLGTGVPCPAQFFWMDRPDEKVVSPTWSRTRRSWTRS
jgi:hypothetical protein